MQQVRTQNSGGSGPEAKCEGEYSAWQAREGVPRLALWAGGAAAGLGTLALVGWHAHSEGLVRVVFGVLLAVSLGFTTWLAQSARRAERKLRSANRALKTVSACDHALVHARDENALLAQVCRIIVSTGGHALAWVGYAENDKAKTVRPVAYAGMEKSYIEQTGITWADSGRGPMGTCIRNRRPAVCRDVLTDPQFAPWREQALAHGFRSSIALPLLRGEQALGALAVYAYESNAFDANEVELLEALAADLAFGVASLRAQAELRNYADELARSNKDLEDFASIASHDLQEPLRKITAFGERLRTHCANGLNEAGQECLGRMLNASRRMGELIEGLLRYSRLTSRALPFEKVDLNTVMLQVMVDLETRASSTRAKVTVENLPVIWADATQMRQLLQNLIANALKFHKPEEPPVVTVSGHRTPEGGCELQICDNGIGFHEKYLDRIFRPFQRLHGRMDCEGSGIGLAICQKIVARHQGEITARSRPGHGATFVVTLRPGAKEKPSCLIARELYASSSPKMMTMTTS